jgi:flagellar export protein FliJ
VTIRPRAVRALRDARVRLRDVAAASLATATAAKDHSHLTLVREQDRLEDFLDEATGVLASATNVHELSRVAEHTGVYKLDIVEAENGLAAASAAASTAADHLRDRARLLRRAEKLVERVVEHHAKVEAKAEQKANDDMSTRRK